MSIIKISNDKIVRPEGTHHATLAAVYSIGLQPGFKGEQPKSKHVYVFELGEKIPDGNYAGEPYIISAIHTDSLNDKSRLIEVIRALRGGLTDQEIQADEFNPESLIGLNCKIVIVNKVNAGKTTATIVSYLKRDATAPLLTPTFDRSKVPAWIKRLQDLRLDKPKSTDNAA